ncbi:MAG: ChaN family lipoprotein [Polyangiaceae bacterium]|nr:ChaN family lipoprotein [Polyangiaceae bacterium]
MIHRLSPGRSPLLLAAALGAFACAHATSEARPQATPADPAPNSPAPPSPVDDEDPLLGEARPFAGQRLGDGAALTGAELLDALAEADLVCVGERRAEPAAHWAELAILYGLTRRAELSGRHVGLALEVWQVDAQKSLDDFVAGKMDEADLLEQTEWRQNWGFDFGLYRPMINFERSSGGELVGVGARRELVGLVAQHGLAALDPELQKDLPELDLDDPEHHDSFTAKVAVARHRRHHDPENEYAAAVLRDETMAAAAARWLGAKQPVRQLILLAGVDHCRRPAVPKRVLRRLSGARALSVLPAASPSESADVPGYDFLFVLGSPE